MRRLYYPRRYNNLLSDKSLIAIRNPTNNN